RKCWSQQEPFMASRLKRLLLRPALAIAAPAGITVHTPVSFPPYRWLQRLNQLMLVRQLQARLQRMGWEQPVLWTYHSSQLALKVCSALNPRLLVYCCVNDYRKLSPEHAPVAEEEKEMIGAADLVFVVPRQLLAAKQKISPHVYSLPQGANLQHYLAQAGQPMDRTELTGLRH